MHTRCPHCSTTFSISQQHLEIAEGQVRCGSCDQVFNGRDNIVDAKGNLVRKTIKEKSSAFETGDDIFGMIEKASAEAESDPEVKAKPKARHIETTDESWADSLIAEEGGHDETAPAPPKIKAAVNRKQSATIVSERVSAPTKPQQTKQARPAPVGKDPLLPRQQQAEFSDEFLNLDKHASTHNPFRDSDQAVQQAAKPIAKDINTHKPDSKSWAEDVWDENGGLSDQDLFDELEALNQPSPPQAAKQKPKQPTNPTKQAKPSTAATKSSKPPAATPLIDDESSIFDELEEFLTAEKPPAADNKTANKSAAANTASKPSIIDELKEIASELAHKNPMRAIPADNKKPQAKKAPDSKTKQAPLFHLNFDPIEIKSDSPPPKPKKGPIIYAFSIMLASVLFAFQFSFFNMDQFARDPLYRPYYQKACAILSCTLPTLQNLNKIHGSHLVVRQHPDHPKALIIDIIMTNKANYPQLFPIMELVFTDSEHAPVRQRQFKPKEYLIGDLATLSAMPANIPIHVSLEVLDPGPKAKGWEINFLNYLN